MQWEFIVALVVVIPIILFPVAFLWYLNAGGIYAAVKQAWAKRAAYRHLMENQSMESYDSIRCFF